MAMKTADLRFILAVSAISLMVACRGGDSGSTSAPTLREIVLAPTSARVSVAGTPPFTVSERRSDGSMVAVAVTFAATGGTITSGGLFAAGSVPGIYQVIATERGGTLAGSAAVMVVSTGARSYTTNFLLTENPISEGGRWINGGAAGLDWTNVSTTPGLAVGNQAGASYTDATALLTGAWGPDQMVSAAVHTVKQNDACYQEVELRLRSTISAHVNTGYEISFKMSQTSQAYLIIVRWNGPLGNFTYLFKPARDAKFGIKDGDVISASIVGNVITAYINGVQKGKVDITSIGGTVYRTGSPGMGFNLENAPAGCSGTNGNYGFTSYTATDLRFR